MNSKFHPVSFDDFYAEYINQLGQPDQPSAYVAYVRAEAHFASENYPRRYINHATFRSSCSRHRARRRLPQKHSIAA